MDATASNHPTPPAAIVPAGPSVASWMQRYRWMILLRSFRVALDARQMIVAAAAVLAMVTGWWGLAKVFSGASDVQQLTVTYGTWPWDAAPAEATNSTYLREVPYQQVAPDGTSSIAVRHEVAPVAATTRPFVKQATIHAYFGPYTRLTAPFALLFKPGLTISGFTFLLVAGIWGVAVWGYAGGVISRMAGVRLARDERATFGPATRHALSHWGSYFWAPLMPLVGVLILGLPIFALGWLLRFDVGVLVLGIAWPLFLVLALVMGILLLGLAVGWPLMWATISVEGTDSFDALSRTYAYVYQRPLQYLWYAAVAGGLGVLAGALITLFAGAIVYLSLWCASWTAGTASTARIAAHLPQGIVGVSRFAQGEAAVVGPTEAAATSQPPTYAAPTPTVSTTPTEPISIARSSLDLAPPNEPTSGMFRAGIAVLGFWLAGVQLLLLGFGFSYFWTATTGIYLLLRYDVDATEMDVVHLEDEPAVFGLPPLETDAAGVAVVSAEEEAAPARTGSETTSAGTSAASQ
jgi:hypothetical protein